MFFKRIFKELVGFVCALVPHMAGLITGGIVAAMIAIYQALGHGLPAWVVWALVAVAFFVAAFAAWRRERRSLEQASKTPEPVSARVLRTGFLVTLSVIMVCWIAFDLLWLNSVKKRLNSNDAVNKNVLSSLHPEYDTAFKKYQYNVIALSTNASNAYSHGDYAYAAMFYRQLSDLPDYTWRAHWPDYAMSTLMQNPTSSGYEEFAKLIDQMVADIENDLKRPKPDRRYDTVGVLNELNNVKELIPASEQQWKEYVDKVKTRIEDMVKAAK